MKKNNTILCKTKSFSLKIIKLYSHLTNSKREYILSKQILRSGTSIGANAKEASAAQSKKDFCAKMYIAFKECVETEYWLELLHESGIIEREMFYDLYTDAQELTKILSSITKTTSENLKGGGS